MHNAATNMNLGSVAVVPASICTQARLRKGGWVYCAVEVPGPVKAQQQLHCKEIPTLLLLLLLGTDDWALLMAALTEGTMCTSDSATMTPPAKPRSSLGTTASGSWNCLISSVGRPKSNAPARITNMAAILQGQQPQQHC
jgi:hypothetical protein